MKQKLLSPQITLLINRFIGLLVTVLVFLLPKILNWYGKFRVLTQTEYMAILIAYYCCVPVVAAALWNLDKLLRNIMAERVFVFENVRRIHRVQRCCGGVSLICLPAAFCYLPLVFIVIIMAFLCPTMGVLAQVMHAAVAIREENDLTI